MTAIAGEVAMKKWVWVLVGAAALLLLSLSAVIILATAYDYNKFKPQVAAAVLELTGRKLTIQGDIRLKIGLNPTLAVADVALQNAPWGSRAQMATVKRLEVKAALLPLLQGAIRIDRLLVDEAEVLIEINPNGRSNFAFTPAERKPADPRASESAGGYRLGAVKGLAVKNSTLTINDHLYGRTGRLVLSSLEMQALDSVARDEVQLEATWNGIPFAVNGRIGMLKHLRDPDGPWPLELTLKALQGTATVRGQIRDPLSLSGIDLQATAEGKDLALLGKLFGEPLPLKGRYRFSGKLSAHSPADISMSYLDIVLGDNALQGNLRFERHAEKYRTSGRLETERLDLRLVLGREETQATREAAPPDHSTKESGRVFPDSPLDLEALRRFDLDLDVHIGRLLLPHLSMDQLNAAVRLSDGRLVLDPLTASAGGGTLKGSLVLETRSPQTTASAALVVEGLDLGVMAQTLDIKETSGRTDLDFHLQGWGRSMAGIMGSLNGDVVISVKDTHIPFRHLNELGATLYTVSKRLLSPSDEQLATAAIRCLVADFSIKNGLAKTDVLVADTDRVSLSGLGTINLRSEEIALGIKTHSKEGFGTKATGEVSIDLGGLADVFQVTGTLAHPSFGVSTEKSLETLAIAAGLTFLTGPFGLVSLFVSKADTAKDPCAVALAAAGRGPAHPQTAPSAGEEKKKGFGDRLRNWLE
jgi:AsmA family protein